MGGGVSYFVANSEIQCITRLYRTPYRTWCTRAQSRHCGVRRVRWAQWAWGLAVSLPHGGFVPLLVPWCRFYSACACACVPVYSKCTISAGGTCRGRMKFHNHRPMLTTALGALHSSLPDSQPSTPLYTTPNMACDRAALLKPSRRVGDPTTHGAAVCE